MAGKANTPGDARRLTLLGILLQSLHILFGVTALLGVLITQAQRDKAINTIYDSHLQWQFVTFWLALIGYATGFYLWAAQSNFWLVLVTALLMVYRLAVSILAWRAHRPINRVW